jgi:hypothetical protein
MLAVDPSAERQGLGTVPRCSPCSVLQWTMSSCPYTSATRTDRDVLGLRPRLGPSPERIVGTGHWERERSHELTCGRGEIPSPSWRFGGLVPPECFIGDRRQPSDLDTRMGDRLECARYIGQSTWAARVAGHVRVGFEVEHTARVTAALASAGSEIFASPTPTRWNSLHARLTALAGWGEAVQQ